MLLLLPTALHVGTLAYIKTPVMTHVLPPQPLSTKSANHASTPASSVILKSPSALAATPILQHICSLVVVYRQQIALTLHMQIQLHFNVRIVLIPV